MSLKSSHDYEPYLTAAAERVSVLVESGGFLTPMLRQFKGKTPAVSGTGYRLSLIGLDALADGAPLCDATVDAGWQFFVAGEGDAVATIEARCTTDKNYYAGAISEGPVVDGTVAAFKLAGDLLADTTAQYEPVLIRSPEMRITALWLRTPAGDLDVVLPIAPIDAPFEPLRRMPLDQFTAAAAQVARDVRARLQEQYGP